MIYVFLGKNFYIVSKKVNELIAKLNINNIIRFDYSEGSLDEILNEVNYVDLFNEKKLIIVSNFSFKKLEEKEEKSLIKYIDNMNDNVIIIRCIDESLDERKSLTKALRNKCKVNTVEKLDYKGIHEYVANELKEHKIKATFNQVKKILDLCEYNVDYTISELEKLLIYKIGQDTLYDKDIDDVISRNTEKELFIFLENIIKKDIAGSLESYKVLLSAGTDEIALISNISNQFRLLMQVKHNKGKMSEQMMCRAFGAKEYTVQKLYPYLHQYSDEEICDILMKLSNMDIDIKVKGYDKDRLMESFLITL